METLWQDVQFALRMMRKKILDLPLPHHGRGAVPDARHRSHHRISLRWSTAVLLQPLALRASRNSHPRLHGIYPLSPQRGPCIDSGTSGPEFLDLRRDTHSWASLDAWASGGVNLAGKKSACSSNGSFSQRRDFWNRLACHQSKVQLDFAVRRLSLGASAVCRHFLRHLAICFWRVILVSSGEKHFSMAGSAPSSASCQRVFSFPQESRNLYSYGPRCSWTRQTGNRGGHNYYLLGPAENPVRQLDKRRESWRRMVQRLRREESAENA